MPYGRAVHHALADRGFGILTKTDVQATLPEVAFLLNTPLHSGLPGLSACCW